MLPRVRRSTRRCSSPSTAWVALLVSGITLAALGVILLLAGHPKAAGRFEDHENWMRFIGAVHDGVARLRADRRARARRARRPRSSTRCRSCATVGFVILTLGVGVPVGAVVAFVPVVAMAQVVPISLQGLGVREGMLVLLLHPLGVSNGQAIGHRPALVPTMLLVSLLGAPAFAVGNRHAAVDAVRSRLATVSTTHRRRRRRRWSTAALPGRQDAHATAHVIYWWVEILAILTFYFVYSAVRNADAAHRRARSSTRSS